MKVIKPTEVVRDTYTDVNSRDVVPAWSSAVTYGSSSTFDKVWVQYQGVVYESIKPVNLNNTPSSVSTWWRTVTTTTTDDFATEVWSSGTTYTSGQVVYYQTSATVWPRYYQSLQNSNLNKIPPDNLVGTTPFWLDLGYTNISKLYDIETSTQTVTTDELVTTFTSRKSTSGGIFGAQGNRVLLTAKSERNLYSANDWNTLSLAEASAPELRAMVFAADKNVLILCGRSGYLKYSKDNGTTWNACTTPTGSPHLLSLAYNKSQSVFIAVGTSNSLSDPVIWRSTDGITWTAIASLPTSSVSLNKVIWIKQLGKFVIAASSGYIYTSDGTDGTGTNWTSASVGAGAADLVGVVYNPANGLIHVVGSQVLRYSSDLSAWTSITVTNENIRAIGVYNTVDETGSSTSQYLYVFTNLTTESHGSKYSGNGTTWTQVGLPVANTNVPTDLTYCYSESKWMLSCTGLLVTWNIVSGFSSTVSPTAFTASLIRVFYNNNTDTVVLFGNSNTFITSPNIYFQEYNLNSSLVDNWYDYFYKDYTLLSEAIFENIPVYTRTRITVCIVGDIVRCGIVFAGSSTSIGTTQYGASAGIIDYSKKETDEFGTTTFIRRAFSKRMNVNLILPSSDLYRVQKVLSDVRATPCIWIGSSADIYKSLTMYGYYKDFSLEIPYPEYSYCSLQVEGLTE